LKADSQLKVDSKHFINPIKLYQLSVGIKSHPLQIKRQSTSIVPIAQRSASNSSNRQQQAAAAFQHAMPVMRKSRRTM